MRRLNIQRKRAVLSIAYQVQLARLLSNAVSENVDSAVERIPGTRHPGLLPRGAYLRLANLEVFSTDDHVIPIANPHLNDFLLSIPESRVRSLIEWNPPWIHRGSFEDDSPSDLNYKVYSNQLIAALARYRMPNEKVLCRVLKSRPRLHLDSLSVSFLILDVYGAYICASSSLICSLAATDFEGGLLTNQSDETARRTRNKQVSRI